MNTAYKKAADFLSVASQFKLGELPTESRNPLTMNLSQQALDNLPDALATLKRVDEHALEVLESKGEELAALATAMKETLRAGHRIFFCGCGATGRLSLSLETFWRESLGSLPYHDHVVAFMAGGDVALIKSIENFEDHPEFGARQLEDLGFGEGDLLVSTTEGGETPFVIGATERAVELSQRTPFFLYCNPDEVLASRVERSRRVLENPGIRKINLTTGPMALAGSTRMQASTILMLGCGSALFTCLGAAELFPGMPPVAPWQVRMAHFRKFLRDADFSFLARFIEREASHYKSGKRIIYETNVYGITILTDTTERSPTFSLAPFENQLDDQKKPSLCYLCLPHTVSSVDAWRTLLHRDPRPIEWPEYRSIAGPQRLAGFDFSGFIHDHRRRSLGADSHHVFSIQRMDEFIEFRLDELCHRVSIAGLSLLEEHSFLKMGLNMLSTLIMGRLGRYKGNLMTWVKPSNYKLIDRSIRYVQHLLEETGIHQFSYDEIAHQCFREMETLSDNEPIVLKTLEALIQKYRSRSSLSHSDSPRHC